MFSIIFSSRPFQILLFALASKAIVIYFFIYFSVIGLGPDEAQYWNWSQVLDWGYYSKPPGIAWQIRLGTEIFGNTEWGVRAVTILISFLQACLIFIIAIHTNFSSRQALYSSLIMAFSPLGFLGSLFAITDVGFIFCWTGACLCIVSALQKNKAPSFLWVGVWILVGALFKWPIYLLWIFLVSFLVWKKIPFSWHSLCYGIFISFIGLFPSLLWNIHHDWATFRHVSATINGGHAETGGNFFSLIGAQILLISPIFFGIGILGSYYVWRRQSPTHLPFLFCQYVTFSGLLFVLILSLQQKIQGNWPIFIYPTAVLFLGYFASYFTYLFWTGIVTSIFLVALVFISPLLPQIPYSVSPFKHNLGWKELAHTLEQEGYNPQKHFLVSDKYQTTSELGFYSEGQKRAYFLNLHGIRKNQFSYWPSLQTEQVHKKGYFVWVENIPSLNKNWEANVKFYQENLPFYFEKVKFLGFVPLLYKDKASDEVVKAALIFLCENPKVSITEETNLY